MCIVFWVDTIEGLCMGKWFYHYAEKFSHPNLKTDEQPKIYGPVQVMFGDKPAAAISYQATADIYKNINEKAW